MAKQGCSSSGCVAIWIPLQLSSSLSMVTCVSSLFLPFFFPDLSGVKSTLTHQVTPHTRTTTGTQKVWTAALWGGHPYHCACRYVWTLPLIVGHYTPHLKLAIRPIQIPLIPGGVGGFLPPAHRSPLRLNNVLRVLSFREL